MKTFRKFIEEEIAANSTANVEGMRTEPVVRRKDQVKIVRRNTRSASVTPETTPSK